MTINVIQCNCQDRWSWETLSVTPNHKYANTQIHKYKYPQGITQSNCQDRCSWDTLWDAPNHTQFSQWGTHFTAELHWLWFLVHPTKHKTRNTSKPLQDHRVWSTWQPVRRRHFLLKIETKAWKRENFVACLEIAKEKCSSLTSQQYAVAVELA